MIYSFSKLETFQSCPFGFWLAHLSDQDIIRQDNAFSQYGTFAHELLEQWAKGELADWQLEAEWADGYDKAITRSFPPYLKGFSAKAYEEGRAYFASFDSFPGFTVVSAEKKFNVQVGNYEFAGIADLVLRDNLTGELAVIDHKTKGQSSMKKDYKTYLKQLYIYAIHVKEEYGEYPAMLGFNMIKPNVILWEEFSEEKLQETIAWVNETCARIEAAAEFPPHPDSHRCQYICDVRGACPHCAVSSRS